MASADATAAPESMLIRGAHLTDPCTGVDGVRDVAVSGGLVARVDERIDPGEVHASRVMDAEGLWLWPGLVDVHVHFREPGFTHKETIQTGSAAAMRGGYTSVVCEPNTQPPLEGPELAQQMHLKALAVSRVRVYFKATMTRGRQGTEPGDYESLAEVPWVVALSDDGDPVVSAAVMEEVCRRASRSGLLLSPHCEDSPRALDGYRAGLDPGFEPGEPYTNEAGYVARDLELARRAGARIHFSHVSLGGSVELIKRARLGRPEAGVTFEVTPHHLLLSGSSFAPGEVPRVCPPLRSGKDLEALQRALEGGEVDAVASDHAPHSSEERRAGASGLIGLETTLGLMLTHFVHAGRLSRLGAAAALSTGPARAFRLPGGSLAVGQPADMVLIDPDEEWVVDSGEFASLSRNTPYEGWRMRGRAAATVVGGEVVFSLPSLEGRMKGWDREAAI